MKKINKIFNPITILDPKIISMKNKKYQFHEILLLGKTNSTV